MTLFEPEFDVELESRLLRYTAIDSQSSEDSPTSPSTPTQFGMLHRLRDELTVLEANAIPGLTETSLLPLATEAAGVGFDAFVARALELALVRPTPPG